jgi:hypothetical protein
LLSNLLETLSTNSDFVTCVLLREVGVGNRT